MDANTTAAHNFVADQPVEINLDSRRAPRAGKFLGDAEKAGQVIVEFESAGKTVTKSVAISKVTAVADVDDPATYGEDLGDLADLAADQAVESTDVDEHGWAADEQVEAPAPADEQGPHTQAECEDLDGCKGDHLADDQPVDDAPAAAARKKADLPAGYVTPVGLAKEINARGLYTGAREGGISSQMMYGYLKGDDTYPGATVNGRLNVVELEAGIGWWKARQAKAAERRDNAATRKASTGQPARLPRTEVVEALRWAADQDDVKAAVEALIVSLTDEEAPAGE